MSIINSIIIKFLNGELLKLEYNPKNELHMLYQHIITSKPELINYEINLFNFSENSDTRIIYNINQIQNRSIIGIYIKKKPYINILFIEPVSFYNIDTSEFSRYSYKGIIQKYNAILHIDENYEAVYRFTFYYNKQSKKFAYDSELHKIIEFEFNDKNRSYVQGYFKWLSITDMLTAINNDINIEKLVEYSILFDNEWNTNLSYFSSQS